MSHAGTSAECLSEETIAAFARGALSSVASAKLDVHIERCPECFLVATEAAKAYDATSQGISAKPDATSKDCAADASAVSIAPGGRLGRYAIDKLLGFGGMGMVYEASDPQLRRKIALKVLRPDRSARGEGALEERLLREARAMARVAHPNVVTVHDAGVVDGRVFVAMEYVEGQTLQTWLREESRSPREVLSVFIDAGQGLAAAHAAGLVHRDFKPANVLVGADGRVRVGDFGLARAGSTPLDASAVTPRDVRLGDDASLTQTGVMLGTPGYMAPEAFGAGTVDARSDIFSFCATLYEALYGERPFRGSDVEDLAERVAAGKIEPAPSAKRVPASLRAILVRGLQVRPEDRYPSMEAVIADLQRHASLWGRMTRARATIATAALVTLAGACLWGWSAHRAHPPREEPTGASLHEAAPVDDAPPDSMLPDDDAPSRHAASPSTSAASAMAMPPTSAASGHAPAVLDGASPPERRRAATVGRVRTTQGVGPVSSSARTPQRSPKLPLKPLEE